MPPRKRRSAAAPAVPGAYSYTGPDGVRASLTAAAQVLSSQRIRRSATPGRAIGDTSWQRDAWDLYDETGELHYASGWVSNALSRVRLVAARKSPTGEPEVLEDGPIAELVAAFCGGPAEQEMFLKRIGHQLTVAGESYIVGRTLPGENDGDPDREVVMPYSNEEVTAKAGTWSLDDGSGVVELGPDDLVIRAWHPHPRRFTWADSSVRSALPVLRELRGLTQHVSAQVDSRLAGAGLLLLPQSMTFPTPPAAAGEPIPEGDPFMLSLIDAMVTPLHDRDSAAAVVPIVVRVPDEAIGKAQYLRFDAPLDAAAKDLRDEAIRRAALALDMPAEILLGLGDTNHWSAWQIDEAGIRLAIAPLAAVVCHAITIGWFRHALADQGGGDPADHLVWFDTTPLELRPDRTEPALQLYDRAELTGQALRRETGFGEEDAPQGEERDRLIVWALLRQSPAIANQLLPLLGIEPPEPPAPEPAQGLAPVPSGGAESPGERTTPGGERSLPGRETAPPEAQAASVALDLAASFKADPELIGCHMAVTRALELTGKRLLARGRRGQFADVPAHELHTVIPFDKDPAELLDGAWDALCETFGEGECARLTPALDSYVLGLLVSRRRHSLDALAEALAPVREPAHA